MGNTHQTQPASQPAASQPAQSSGSAGAGAANSGQADAANQARLVELRRAVPQRWAALLGGLMRDSAPAAGGAQGGDPAPAAHGAAPDAGHFGREAYKILRAAGGNVDTAGAQATQNYLTLHPDGAALKNELAAVRAAHDADSGSLTTIQNGITSVIGGNTLAQSTNQIIGTYGLLNSKSKRWIADQTAVLSRLDGYGQSGAFTDGMSEANEDATAIEQTESGNRRKQGVQSLVTFLRSQGAAGGATRTGGQSQHQSEEQNHRFDQEFGELRSYVVSALQGHAAGGRQAGQRAAHSAQGGLDQHLFQQILRRIRSASPQVRDRIWDERLPDGETVTQMLRARLSPTQMQSVETSLDTVEALYQACVDASNRGRQHAGAGGDGADPGRAPAPAARVDPAQLIIDYCTARPGTGGAAARQRVRYHTQLYDGFVKLVVGDRRIQVDRAIDTGSTEPDATERVHMAARQGNGVAAVEAIMQLGGDRQRLEALQSNQVFLNSIRRMNDEVVYQGMRVRPYDLFLRMCGLNPYSQAEPGTVQQATVNPDGPDARQPLTPAERRRLDEELYRPAVQPLADELNATFYVNDSTVMGILHSFQRRAASMQELLHKAEEAPGPTLSQKVQAAGANVRHAITNGLDEDNKNEAETILGFRVDAASHGDIGGRVEFAGGEQNRSRPVDPNNPRGRQTVPLDQALRETLCGGQTCSEFIRAKAQAMAAELDESWVSGGGDADDVLAIWHSYTGGMSDQVMRDLRDATGLRRLWKVELFGNVFREVEDGGDLGSKLRSGLDAEEQQSVMPQMGMTPGAAAARAEMAAQDARQTQDDAGTGGLVERGQQLQQQQQGRERMRQAATQVWNLVGALRPAMQQNPEQNDSAYRTAGQTLREKMAMSAVAPQSASSSPAAGAIPQIGARPGGPARIQGAPSDPQTFADYYRAEYGIPPERHAAEVCRANSNQQRSAAQLAELMGISANLATEPPQAPAEELSIGPQNRSLVGPHFSVAEAERRARRMWTILHDSGQTQLLGAQLDGCTPEEQRLIHIAFRRLSGGIDLRFYLQQARRQQDQGGAGWHMFSQVGAGGTEAGQEALGDRAGHGIHVAGRQGEIESLLDVTAHGRVTIKVRISGAIDGNNMNGLYSLVGRATADERREVLADGALMSRLRGFCDDAYEWDRVYRGLTGQMDLYTQLESRAHGEHGVLGGMFDATDEDGMRDDVREYMRERMRANTEAVRNELIGANPTPQQVQAALQRDPQLSHRIEEEAKARTRRDAQHLMANPAIHAIVEDELSGTDLSRVEGLILNQGEEGHDAYLLNDGDLTEDEEHIISDVQAMSVQERQARLADPEWMRRARAACESDATWRDLMNALRSQAAPGADDHLADLEEASRTNREDGAEMNINEDDIVENVMHMRPEELRQLLQNPGLMRQVMRALEDFPERRTQVQAMLAYNPEAAAQATGLRVPGEGQQPDPEHGIYAQAEVQRLGFLRHSIIQRIKMGCGRSWAPLLHELVYAYSAALRPGESASGGGAHASGTTTAHVASAGPPAPAAGAAPATAGAAPAAPAGAPAPAPAAAPGRAPAHAAPAAGGGGAAGGAQQHQPTPAEEQERHLREGIWEQVEGAITAATSGWGTIDDMFPATQLVCAERAVKKERDPSNLLFARYTGGIDDDEEMIKRTLREASDDMLISDWTTVMKYTPNGGLPLREVYHRYAGVRDREAAQRAAAPAPAAGGAPPQQTSQDLWDRRNAFAYYIVDTSRDLESQLLRFTGGLAADDHATHDGERRVRDNSEWLEWRTIVRDRIPHLDKSKILQAIGAGGDPDAVQLFTQGETARSSLTQLSYDEERYEVARGENSNYNMDRLTAGGEGQALDQSMADLRGATYGSIISTDEGQYGQVTEEESTRIGDMRRQFNSDLGAFNAAKQAVANIATAIVAVIITAVVTILTAGTATGPVAVMLLGALTGGSAALGQAAANEAVLGTGYNFSDEGLRSVAQGAIMGAVSAGTTYYAGAIMRGVSGAATYGQQAASVAESVATKPAVWQQILSEAGHEAAEEALQTSMEGLIESGAQAFRPAFWMQGWSEGWRRGSAAARHRAAQIPGDALRAAVSAALSTTIEQAGSHAYGAARNRLRGGAAGQTGEALEEAGEAGRHAGSDATDEAASRSTHGAHGEGADTPELRPDGIPVRGTLGERAHRVGHEIVEGVPGGIVGGAVDVALDERTWRAEGELSEALGSVSMSALDDMKSVANSLHISDAHCAQRARQGAESLAQHQGELSPHEVQMYRQMVVAGEGTSAMTVPEFQRARREQAEATLAHREAESGQPYSAAERAAFITWCRQAGTLDEFDHRTQMDPADVPQVQQVTNTEAAQDRRAGHREREAEAAAKREREQANPREPAQALLPRLDEAVSQTHEKRLQVVADRAELEGTRRQRDRDAAAVAGISDESHRREALAAATHARDAYGRAVGAGYDVIVAQDAIADARRRLGASMAALDAADGNVENRRALYRALIDARVAVMQKTRELDRSVSEFNAAKRDAEQHAAILNSLVTSAGSAAGAPATAAADAHADAEPADATPHADATPDADATPHADAAGHDATAPHADATPHADAAGHDETTPHADAAGHDETTTHDGAAHDASAHDGSHASGGDDTAAGPLEVSPHSLEDAVTRTARVQAERRGETYTPPTPEQMAARTRQQFIEYISGQLRAWPLADREAVLAHLNTPEGRAMMDSIEGDGHAALAAAARQKVLLWRAQRAQRGETDVAASDPDAEAAADAEHGLTPLSGPHPLESGEGPVGDATPYLVDASGRSVTEVMESWRDGDPAKELPMRLQLEYARYMCTPPHEGKQSPSDWMSGYQDSQRTAVSGMAGALSADECNALKQLYPAQLGSMPDGGPIPPDALVHIFDFYTSEGDFSIHGPGADAFRSWIRGIGGGEIHGLQGDVGVMLAPFDSAGRFPVAGRPGQGLFIAEPSQIMHMTPESYGREIGVLKDQGMWPAASDKMRELASLFPPAQARRLWAEWVGQSGGGFAVMTHMNVIFNGPALQGLMRYQGSHAVRGLTEVVVSGGEQWTNTALFHQMLLSIPLQPGEPIAASLRAHLVSQLRARSGEDPAMGDLAAQVESMPDEQIHSLLRPIADQAGSAPTELPHVDTPPDTSGDAAPAEATGHDAGTGGTAAAVPGSSFRGDAVAHDARDEAATRGAIDAAIPRLADMLGGQVGGDGSSIDLTLPDGGTVAVHVVMRQDDGGQHSSVASFEIHGDVAVVHLSPGAQSDHVERALAHEMAEIRDIMRRRRAGEHVEGTTALAEGSQARELSPHDLGRVAELRVLHRQIEECPGFNLDTGEASTPQAIQLLHQLQSLLLHMGLHEGQGGVTLPELHHGPDGQWHRMAGGEAISHRTELLRQALGDQFPQIQRLLELSHQHEGNLEGIRAQASGDRAALRRYVDRIARERGEADAALTERVNAAIGATGGGHVFARLIIGGGWSAVADFATMRGAQADGGQGIPPVMAIAMGGDPWAGRGEMLMGQGANELEVPGFTHQPADFADDQHGFAQSRDFGAAAAGTRAEVGMPTYRGQVTRIEERPSDPAEADSQGWPEGARYRVCMGDPDSPSRVFFAAAVDVSAGPGPARRPKRADDSFMVSQGGQLTSNRVVDPSSGYAVEPGSPPRVFDPSGAVADPTTLPAETRRSLGFSEDGGFRDPRMVRDEQTGYLVNRQTGQIVDDSGSVIDPESLSHDERSRLEGLVPRLVSFGGEQVSSQFPEGAHVLVYGAGASGSWDVEQAHGAADRGVSVDWSARSDTRSLADTDPDKQKVQQLRRRIELEGLQAQGSLDGDQQRELAGLPDFDATERQRLMDREREASFSGGFNRRNTAPGLGAHSPEVRGAAPQSVRQIQDMHPTPDGRVFVRFDDGTTGVYDQVVMSIGQDRSDVGGPMSLVPQGMQLEPSRGAEHRMLGAENEDGSFRVIGAAGTTAGPRMNDSDQEEFDDGLRRQAGSMPEDTRGVIPGVRAQSSHIPEMNRGSEGHQSVVSPAARQEFHSWLDGFNFHDSPQADLLRLRMQTYFNADPVGALALARELYGMRATSAAPANGDSATAPPVETRNADDLSPEEHRRAAVEMLVFLARPDARSEVAEAGHREEFIARYLDGLRFNPVTRAWYRPGGSRRRPPDHRAQLGEAQQFRTRDKYRAEAESLGDQRDRSQEQSRLLLDQYGSVDAMPEAIRRQYQSHQSAMRDSSHELGVLAADEFASSQGFDPSQRCYPPPGAVESRSSDFDCVYYNEGPPSSVLVVEAKGGTGSLGAANFHGQRYQQGTTGYLRRLLLLAPTRDVMVTFHGHDLVDGTPKTWENISLNQALRLAFQQSRGRYFVVKAPAGTADEGGFGDPTAREANLPPRREGAE